MSIHSEAARENFLAAKQQRKIEVQTFFTHDPLLELYVQSPNNVEQTLTLTWILQATNICNDSNGPPAVCDESVPKSKLMILLNLEDY